MPSIRFIYEFRAIRSWKYVSRKSPFIDLKMFKASFKVHGNEVGEDYNR